MLGVKKSKCWYCGSQNLVQVSTGNSVWYLCKACNASTVPTLKIKIKRTRTLSWWKQLDLRQRISNANDNYLLTVW